MMVERRRHRIHGGDDKGMTMGTRMHGVVAGETLWGLAKRYYRESRLHPVLAAVNDISDATQIPVGKVLWIPDLGSRRTHNVVGRDELGKLAKRYYGAASRWPVIAEGNGIRGPRKLPEGQLLWIPDLAIDTKEHLGHLIELVSSREG
jgi:nucleoid-associated protein YgaU